MTRVVCMLQYKYPEERWDYSCQRTVEMLEVLTGTVGQQTQKHGSLCHAQWNDLVGTCWTAVSPSKLLLGRAVARASATGS